jgi:ABC-type phosphate transport system substrate-binding protein
VTTRAAVAALLAVATALAQDAGVIRALGNYHMETILKLWEAGFHRDHPQVRFEDKMLGTANAIAGLYLETADIALMGREIMPMESIAFRRVFRYDPTGIAWRPPVSTSRSRPLPSPSSFIKTIRFHG